MTDNSVTILIVGFITLLAGIALYPLADEKPSKEKFYQFCRNLMDSYPIVIGAFMMVAAILMNH